MKRAELSRTGQRRAYAYFPSGTAAIGADTAQELPADGVERFAGVGPLSIVDVSSE